MPADTRPSPAAVPPDAPDPAALVRGYFAAGRAGGEDGLAAIVAPDLLDSTRAVARRVCAAFPDYEVVVLHMVIDGDGLAVAWLGRGTHRGVWESPVGPVAPTGRRVAVCGMTAFRLGGGRIAEVVASTWDHLGLLQQMGAAPTTAERPGA